MSNSIQHVLLTGNIGKIHQFESNDPNATTAISFSLAIKDSVRQQDGSYTDNTTWVDCKAYGRTAEYVVDKGIGSYVSVTGNKLGLRTYQAQNGPGATLTLNVQDVRIQPSYFNGGQDTTAQQPQRQAQKSQPAPQAEPDFDDMEGEDFPF